MHHIRSGAPHLQSQSAKRMWHLTLEVPADTPPKAMCVHRNQQDHIRLPSRCFKSKPRPDRTITTNIEAKAKMASFDQDGLSMGLTAFCVPFNRSVQIRLALSPSSTASCRISKEIFDMPFIAIIRGRICVISQRYQGAYSAQQILQLSQTARCNLDLIVQG